MGRSGEQRLMLALGGIDKMSEWTGRVYSWVLVPLTLMVTSEVVSRYVFNRPHAWITEIAFYMYGSLAILVAAYTLRHGGHVGVDIFSSRLSPRTKAVVDMVAFLIFFVPFVAFLIPPATSLAVKSFAMGERSTYAMLPFEPYFKASIPIGLTMLLLQGVAGFVRSLVSSTTGRRNS